MKKRKELKNVIAESLLDSFPELAKYTSTKFYKIVGSTIVGIELIDLPRSEGIRPCFVVYSLLEGELDECLSAPKILIQFKKENKMQLNIAYNESGEVIDNVFTLLKNQLLISLDGDIDLNRMISLIDNYSTMPPLSVSKTSYLQAKLIEFKYKLTLLSNPSHRDKVLHEIKKVDWDNDHFCLWNTDVDSWFNLLENLSQAELNDKVMKNTENNKLKKLQKFDLIPDIK